MGITVELRRAGKPVDVYGFRTTGDALLWADELVEELQARGEAGTILVCSGVCWLSVTEVQASGAVIENEAA